MRIAVFTHSLVSDWNHGNAHFLRGIAAELMARGHQVLIFEPEDGWSLRNLLDDCGPRAVEEFHAAFPELHSAFYSAENFDLNSALAGTDLLIVHEWNSHQMVKIGRAHV